MTSTATTLTQLAGEHARGLERRGVAFAGFRALLRFAVLPVVPLIVGGMNRIARRMRDRAVWYEGAAAALDRSERAEPADPDFTLIERLRRLELLLQEGGEANLQRIASRRRPRHPELEAATNDMVRAAEEFRSALREFRGALQAYEADRCAIRAAGSPARSREALQEALSSLDDAR